MTDKYDDVLVTAASRGHRIGELETTLHVVRDMLTEAEELGAAQQILYLCVGWIDRVLPKVEDEDEDDNPVGVPT